MIAYYPQIKMLHVACVIASLSLFAFRGTFSVLLEKPWGDHGVLRYASYAVDTGLLTFALMLATMLHLGPIAQPWFGTKLVLLVLYVMLGALALRRARTRAMRFACFFAALLVAAWMYGVARAHHPAGWWVLLG
ncbi:SirB2 family protein [Pseudomarimonas salicorniae]|uniref:SirB2 family protein n=1 Tax=Pseudomarimonas salicorniae TaxID=2933270 RepID=A0ABT0GF67_9GAMM|nr:SirB2 family protein [Lysobacter sp. CAU 1642]MCK7592677.1 SirB2 family protein [Lysobacter sp. CAU 1642]